LTPLIDSDVLRYELGFSSEFKDEATGEIVAREWEFVEELIDSKIEYICEEVGAKAPPILFLTQDSTTSLVLSNGKSAEYIPNFREKIAVSAPYKGTRKSTKPLHYANITAYMLGKYSTIVANGLEADDMMAINQTDKTIICSRDKDLRQVPGNHYVWECGRQPSLGPLKASFKGKLKMHGDKVVGTGMSFFHYQLLVGDSVDNILGAKGWGTKKAYNLLQGIASPKDQFREVRNIYNDIYGGDAEDKLLENGQLLWLVRSLDGEGKPVMWDIESHEANIA
jgi:hypothetical protein